MGLRDDVVTALDSIGINQPTVIQVCFMVYSKKPHNIDKNI